MTDSQRHDPATSRRAAHSGARGLSRRRLLHGGLLAAASGFAPRRGLAAPASATVSLGAVGVGGKGYSDLVSSSLGENVRISALCDVDANHLQRAARRFPDARTYRDYRTLLQQMRGELDGLLISTPDHMHGPVALAAMQLGLHVHVQKPLAHNLGELRAMERLAHRHGLITQMGTQMHSHRAYRTATRMIRAGAIGRVSEAHLWVGVSWDGPPQGRPPRVDPVPGHLDWDLWLGAAPERPHVAGLYHPREWRRWQDFGTGTLGDFGCHLFDPVFSSLGLGPPSSVFSSGPRHHPETFAAGGDVLYRFPGTPWTADSLLLRWTDGAVSPDAARAQLPPGRTLPEIGLFLVGEGGVMVLPHVAMPEFYRDGERLELPIEAVEGGDHYTEFTDACRGLGETSTPFSYSGPVTEAVLVGTVAGGFPGQELRWNSRLMSFDAAAANVFIHRTYRPGRTPDALLCGDPRPYKLPV